MQYRPMIGACCITVPVKLPQRTEMTVMVSVVLQLAHEWRRVGNRLTASVLWLPGRRKWMEVGTTIGRGCDDLCCCVVVFCQQTDGF